jgi:hypothetical protein
MTRPLYVNKIMCHSITINNFPPFLCVTWFTCKFYYVYLVYDFSTNCQEMCQIKMYRIKFFNKTYVYRYCIAVVGADRRAGVETHSFSSTTQVHLYGALGVYMYLYAGGYWYGTYLLIFI